MIKYLDWDTNFFGFKTGKIVNVVDSITLENILNKLKGQNVDVVCGGPPCQSFSLAGKR